MKRILLALILCGCGGDDEPPMKKGEFCDGMGSAVCLRAASCQLDTFDACFQPFKANCCINTGTCSQDVKAGGDQVIANCRSAMPTADCQQLAKGILPAACWMSP